MSPQTRRHKLQDDAEFNVSPEFVDKLKHAAAAASAYNKSAFMLLRRTLGFPPTDGKEADSRSAPFMRSTHLVATPE